MSVKWMRQSDTPELLDKIKLAYGHTELSRADIAISKPAEFSFSSEDVKRVNAQLEDIRDRLRSPRFR